MSTYRATLTAADGTATTREGVTQDEWDAMVEAYEVAGSPFPAGLRERLASDGTWKFAGEYDTRPREIERHIETPAELDARRRREMAEDHSATVAINQEHDRRENRRSYYLRTGR
jgi:hypothetical protein